MEWQQKGGTYWVRYVDVEIVGFTPGNTSSLVPAGTVSSASSEIRVGDRVRVRPSVTTPKYKWGSVTHRSVGTVIAIASNRCDVTVNFPEQTRWTGLLSEMERVDSSGALEPVALTPSPPLAHFDSATVAATLQGEDKFESNL